MRINGLSYQLVTKDHSRGNLFKELRKILKRSKSQTRRKVKTRRKRKKRKSTFKKSKKIKKKR